MTDTRLQGVALASYLSEIAEDLKSGRAADNQRGRALESIRHVIFSDLCDNDRICLINQIVGEGLYGDFPGSIERAEAL